MSHLTLARHGAHAKLAAIRTALYRYFDRDGNLLYVGVTKSPATRHENHVMKSPWIRFVAGSPRVEWFEDRTRAEARETASILVEQPLFNIDGNDTPEASARLAMYLSRHGNPTPARDGIDIDLDDFASRVKEELGLVARRRLRMREWAVERETEGQIGIYVTFDADVWGKYWEAALTVVAAASRFLVDRPANLGDPVIPPTPRLAASGRTSWELAHNAAERVDTAAFSVFDTGIHRYPPHVMWPKPRRRSA